MSLGPEVVACADQDAPSWVPLSTSKLVSAEGRVIQPPQKIHDVSPVYPDALLDAGIAGRVVIEAILSRAGCVSFATVKRSPQAQFSLAALSAVTRWRFSPTLLDGSPVPVVMTVTVNFSLKK